MPPERYIGLAGLGFMGRGIARCLLQHGFHVIALDPAARSVFLGSENLTLAESAKDLARCEVILETITEDFDAKQRLYDELEAHVGPGVPIASNTSGFPITRLQAPRRHPNRFVGMHWSSPAYASAFLEIIRGEQTDDETVKLIDALARKLEKEPGLVRKDLPGFVVNRIAYAMYREALHLAEEGVASMEDIDSLCRNSIGIWMPLCGPFRWMDISGGPALYATVMETIVPTLSNRSTVPETMQQLRKEDQRGTQNGAGFYRYQPGDAAEWDRKLEEQALKVWAERKR